VRLVHHHQPDAIGNRQQNRLNELIVCQPLGRNEQGIGLVVDDFRLADILEHVERLKKAGPRGGIGGYRKAAC
jgi:hypothetical protein